ncbi:Vitamin B12-dependent ribonucleoside-diphosphate reductase [Candidatus Anstonella stagnisolia]|nr:Vitamin B12-dependent ribonucleoside-diphosphate reductase [Candidatus Anstonella stagnisolia]
MAASKIQHIKKRDGSLVPFNPAKIQSAISKAVRAVGGTNLDEAQKISDAVVAHMLKTFPEGSIPTVEEIQDCVEKILIERGHAKTAKAYILYRQKRNEERTMKSMMLGLPLDRYDNNFSINSIKVLKERYLKRDGTGKITETPTQLFHRVAHNIAQADLLYDKNADIASIEEQFFQSMVQKKFMPNSPTLMNAGSDIQQLSACFVLPVEDSIDGIFTTLKNAALIHQSGGGTGFSFTRLRPKNDLVKSTMGVSSGPVSFMKVFDTATEAIKQGGKRRGANMGILRVDHPDILDFIAMKADMKTLQNFNISVAVTDKFMHAVEKNEDYDLLNPRTRAPMGKLSARYVFDLLVSNAWKNGDPGVIFIDAINRHNSTIHVAEMESTNPCGEQPLPPYESCNLGSINVGKFVTPEGAVDWDSLSQMIHMCVHFLDNVIDMNRYPIPEIERCTKNSRRIGLGVMGFADMLIKLGIKYDSEEGAAFGEKLAKFMEDEATKESLSLAKVRGPFPNWKGCTYDKKGEAPRRNAALTTEAPTGTIGMIADCSGGIEPLFAIAYIKRVMDGKELVYIDENFEEAAKFHGIYSEELMKKVVSQGTVAHIDELPQKIRDVFVTAHDITPYWHTHMQAAFQKYVDAAVSKTVNFPSSATIKDVEEVYMLAFKMGCKGVTIYRDGSRSGQVLNIGASAPATQPAATPAHASPSEMPQTLASSSVLPPMVAVEHSKTHAAPSHAAHGIGAAAQAVANSEGAASPAGAPAAHSAKGSKENGTCPNCAGTLYFSEGCATCIQCGSSMCSSS